MAQVKLVAESIKEYTEEIKLDLNEGQEELNEGSKGSLKKFLKAPEKYGKSFLRAYVRQFSKVGGQKLKAGVDKIALDSKKKLAQQSLDALEKDPKKAYAWLQIRGGKIVGAGAIGAKKGELGTDLGA